MDYWTLKYVHVTSVIVSYTLFFLRGLWMQRASPMLRQRWVKITPHINDTILLTSAIMLAVLTHRNPLVESWLAAKIIGLLVYILLGLTAFRLGNSKQSRMRAWIAAQVVFIYIVSVAITKNPAVIF